MLTTHTEMKFLANIVLFCLCGFVDCKPLLIILLDGFRWDYLDIYGEGLVGFPKLMKMGVQAQHLVMDFPTQPLTNEVTLMTGLYNEYHGIVSDTMYDSVHNEEFSSNRQTPSYLKSFWWENAEPVWITAEKQNKSTYLYEWPLCDVKIHGIQPTFCLPYEKWVSMKTIRTTLGEGINLLANSTADLVGIYIKLVGTRGSRLGPSSPDLGKLLRNLDKAMSLMIDLITNAGLKDTVSVMVMSNHGMIEVSPSRTTSVSDIVNNGDIERYLGGGGFLSVWPKQNKFDEVYNTLRGRAEHMYVYKREETPESWHYRKHYRIAPIIVSPEKGWMVLAPNQTFPFYGKSPQKPRKGNYGYNNLLADMWGVFIATGPGFRPSYRAKPIDAVDVYQMMCQILEVEPGPHNGTWEHVQAMFISAGRSTMTSDTLSPSFIFVLLILWVF